MKKHVPFLLLLLISFIFAEEHSPSQKEIELERQRLELERGWLELERQRLNLEKERYLDAGGEYIIEYEEIVETVEETPAAKDFYIGLDFALTGNGQRALATNGDKNDESVKTSGAGIKLGFGAQEENRIELFAQMHRYQFADSPDEWRVTLYGIDYLFLFHESLGKRLSPYLKVGYTIAESDSYLYTMETLGYPADSKTGTTTGTGYKLGTGLAYRINQNLEAGLGIEYVHIHWNKILILTGSSYAEIKTTDEVTSFLVNLNYYL